MRVKTQSQQFGRESVWEIQVAMVVFTAKKTGDKL